MDKNSIKKYAVWARNELIARVAQKANQYGITEAESISASADSIHGKLLTPTEKKQRAALIEKIKNKGKNGFQLVMEEVAYTWFNRFTAIRFMEVNGYLPSHVRVFTDDENRFAPQILAEAIHLEMPGLDMEKVFELKQANKTEELYKYLIITQCNALNEILPGMFQKIDDYSELLLPDNLLRDGSVVEQMIALIPEEDWTDQVQIIGWLYQFYNTEPKDLVFANLKKNIKISKEAIPAATQIFTPDWVVRYMVENSLGRFWIEGHPNDELKSTWKYYLDETKQEDSVQSQLDTIRKKYAGIKPEEIKVIDPCMGSGHILCYMFDVLVQIYEAYGYTAKDAVTSIVQNNIFGLDIDERAAQLSYFAVMMKARQYDRRFFSRLIKPNVYAIVESNRVSADTIDYFVAGNEEIERNLNKIIKALKDAKEYGSIVKIEGVDFELLYEQLNAIGQEVNIFSQLALEELQPVIKVAELLAKKYNVVVTNPPYMSANGMTSKLSDFVKKEYPDTKSDLSTVFMEKTLEMCDAHGYMAMINIPVWMFLTSYEELRFKLLKANTFINMLHLGRGVFGSDFGTTSFVINKSRMTNYNANYLRLFRKQGAVDSIEEKEAFFFKKLGQCYCTQENFGQIPGSPIAYWLNQSTINAFASKKIADGFGNAKKGLSTGSNDTFLRLWYEVDPRKCGFSLDKYTEPYKWIPLNKGGAFRKWYGNNEYIINWSNNGAEIKNFNGSVIRNPDYYFRESITWTMLSASCFGVRFSEKGKIFEGAGPSLFVNHNDIFYLLALLCSKLGDYFIRILNPTININIGDVCNVPVIVGSKEEIDELSIDCVNISKADWDSYETSWNFEKHPMVVNNCTTVESAFESWKKIASNRFEQMKRNEERINSILIDLYGLSSSLSEQVDDENITIHRADLQNDIRSFISYAVGCMFGRYSLDVDGIVYAGGNWDESKYTTFRADKDNVLPICDDEYFEDDIVGKFVKFVEAVYGKDTLEDNLKFIADALGGSGSPRDVIRSYFLNDFYADHLKIYQKRPIYWQFDSGKKNGFKCLIYMHRYQPDTIARIRTDYVHEQQARYRTAIADLEQRIQVATTSERVKLTKQLQKLKDQETEIRLFEEKVHHLADQMIRIDLDDGVKHNYEIFKEVLTKIK